ncbi:MAG: hypothetical protein ACPF9K_08550 [Neptuniibacter sp.]
MQFAIIVTEVESFTSESGGQVMRLIVSDHKGRSISVIGAPEQQINIQTVKNQMLPMIVLSDQVDRISDTEYLIPEKSLVSVVPLESKAIKMMLEAGKADEVLQNFAVLP